MIKQDKSNQSIIHNIHYATGKQHNYRLRLYRDDKKIYEKQMHIPELSTFSSIEHHLMVLRFFANKIATDYEKKGQLEYFNEEIINIMNRAYFISNLFEVLRSAENERN